MPEKRILPERGVVEVTFTMPAEVGAGRIELVGDFTNWNAVDMERQQDGGWALTLELPPSRRYEYRYRIDEARWENDWRADDYVANQHGQDNSVVVTPAIHATSSSPPAGAQKAGAGKAPAKKATAKKATAKKAGGTTSPAKTTAAKKAPGKKAPARKASVSKPAVTKAAGAKKAAGSEQPAAKKAAPKKTAAKKTPAGPSSPDA